MASEQAQLHDERPSTSSSITSNGNNGAYKKSGRRIAIAYLRNDLRTLDNASLYYAHYNEHKPTHILPLYVYDERQIECSGLPGYKRKGDEARTRLCRFWRSGVFKTRFLTEAVFDVQHRLRERRSGLLVRFGYPEDVVVNLVKALQARGDEIVAFEMQKEMCVEEIAVEKKITKRLKELGITAVRLHATKEMIHKDDLPFSIDKVPDVFTPFRKRVEALGDKMVRKLLEMPDHFLPFPHTEENPIRDDDNYGTQLETWTYERLLECLFHPLKDSYEVKYAVPGATRHQSSAFPWMGGETAALDRLEYYFLAGKPPPVARYKETRNMLLGHEYSTKMSPFLSIGCISPRQISAAIDAHEDQYGSSQNTYWVRFELLWRDYFLYVAQKFGNHLFKLDGFEAITDPKMAAKKIEEWNDWDPDNYQLKAWLRGRTGVPFIDANIIELRETGFMSNRGRQNVASFLTKDLYFDWRIGAEFFESHLVDYEPTANWGNWQYVAGVGNDPRASRQFNPIKQARDYDPQGDYVRTWIVQLSDIPAAKVHTPWLLSDVEWDRHVAKAAGKIAQDHRKAQLIPPSVTNKPSRQALSAEAVGRLGLADHTKGRRPIAKQQIYSGQIWSEENLQSASRQWNRRDDSSRSSLSNAGSGSTGEQTGALRHEGYASESTGASSYSVSDGGGADSEVNESKKPANVRPASHRSRSSGTTVSESEAGSAESSSLNNTSSSSDLMKARSQPVNHKSASTINKGTKEKDDFIAEVPYPRTPLFEQESWKPHYHRKDYGRKKAGSGTTGGNSRRLVRHPPPKKS